MINLIGYSVLVGIGSLGVVLYANYKSKEYRKWLDNLCKKDKIDDEYIEIDRKWKETYAEFMKTVELINETNNKQLESIDKTMEYFK